MLFINDADKGIVDFFITLDVNDMSAITTGDDIENVSRNATTSVNKMSSTYCKSNCF